MLTFKFMVDKSFNESHLRHEEHVQSGAVGCNLVQWVFVNASNGLASSKRLTTKLHWKTNHHKYNFWKHLLNKFKFKIIKKWNLTKKNAWYWILQKHLNQIGKEAKMGIWGLREIWQENCIFNLQPKASWAGLKSSVTRHTNIAKLEWSGNFGCHWTLTREAYTRFKHCNGLLIMMENVT